MYHVLPRQLLIINTSVFTFSVDFNSRKKIFYSSDNNKSLKAYLFIAVDIFSFALIYQNVVIGDELVSFVIK